MTGDIQTGSRRFLLRIPGFETGTTEPAAALPLFRQFRFPKTQRYKTEKDADFMKRTLLPLLPLLTAALLIGGEQKLQGDFRAWNSGRTAPEGWFSCIVRNGLLCEGKTVCANL